MLNSCFAIYNKLGLPTMRNMHLCILFLFLAGCRGHESPKVLIADGEVRAYSEPDGKQTFIINKGEVCAAGRKEITKEYQYLEVACPGKGSAWVITGDPFRVEEKRL